MRFYYHLNGDHIGRLSVKTRQCVGCVETVAWTRNVSAGNQWIRHGIYLRSSKAFQVVKYIIYFIVISNLLYLLAVALHFGEFFVLMGSYSFLRERMYHSVFNVHHQQAVLQAFVQE